MIEKMERETGIEPATSSLGSWRSTAELLPLAGKDAEYYPSANQSLALELVGNNLLNSITHRRKRPNRYPAPCSEDCWLSKHVTVPFSFSCLAGQNHTQP